MILAWLLTAAVHATQVVCGLVLLRALDDRQSSWPGRLGRALVLGPMGITLQMMAMHLVGVRYVPWLVLAPWWLLAAVLKVWRAGAPATRPCPVVVAAGLALFALVLFESVRVPVFSGDAMHNFALPAGVFASHGSLAPQALRALADPGHIEYPPLVALNEAVILQLTGQHGLWAIKAFPALAFLAVCLLAIEACGERLRPGLARPLALAFVCTPILAKLATDAAADLRLVASLLGLVLEPGRWRGRALDARDALRLAAWGLCCALTKVEGLPIAAGTLVALVYLAGRGRLAMSRAALAAALLAGLCAVWPIVQGGGMFRGEGHGLDPTALGDLLHRVPTVLAFFLWRAPTAVDLHGWPSWGVLWPLAALLAVFGIVAAKAARLLWPLGLLLLHLLLYTAVMATTTARLDWHLATAGYRLAMHLAPWLLLVCLTALAASTPPDPARS